MLGEAAALAAAACWAVGSHLFGRIGRSGEVPPGAMNLGKCVTAATLSGATILVLGGRLWPTAPPAAIRWLVASGVAGLALGDLAYFGALTTIGVRRAILLLSTAPVFAAIGGALWLDERIGLRDGLAIAAVLTGVVLVVYERTAPPASAPASAPPASGPLPSAGGAASGASAGGENTVGLPSVAGLALGVLAGVGQAAGSLMSRAAMASESSDAGSSPDAATSAIVSGASAPHAPIGALEASFVRLCAGIAGLVVLAAVAGRLGPWTRVLSRPPTLGRVAGSAVIGTYIGIWLAQFAIGHAASTAIASTLLATTPIFALPLGRLFAAERITARAVTGTLVACAGLAGLTLAAR